MKQPPSVVLLRFYRQAAEKLRVLQARGDKDFAEVQEMDRLEKMLADDVEETFIQRLESAWRGTLTSSGDPIWDDWVHAVQTGNIPDSWLGELRNGVKG